jgi:hypothetical protein
MLVDVRVIILVEENTMGKYLHPYTESGTLRAYTCMYIMVTTHQQGDRLSHHQKFDEPIGIQFYFGKKILRTDVGWCKGRTLGRRQRDG